MEMGYTYRKNGQYKMDKTDNSMETLGKKIKRGRALIRWKIWISRASDRKKWKQLEEAYVHMWTRMLNKEEEEEEDGQEHYTIRLRGVKWLACLGITVAMSSTPTATMKTLLDLPPLRLVVKSRVIHLQYKHNKKV